MLLAGKTRFTPIHRQHFGTVLPWTQHTLVHPVGPRGSPHLVAGGPGEQLQGSVWARAARAPRKTTPDIATEATAPPSTRTARLRGMGCASERATSSRKVLICPSSTAGADHYKCEHAQQRTPCDHASGPTNAFAGSPQSDRDRRHRLYLKRVVSSPSAPAADAKKSGAWGVGFITSDSGFEE